MLQRCRLLLQEKGVIDFVSGTGPGATQYLILDSVLAPEKVDKKRSRVDRMSHRGGHNVHPIYKSYEYSKDKISFKKFQGMSDKDRAFLRERGLL